MEGSVFELVLGVVLSGDLGLSEHEDLKPLSIGLSLLRQPATFRVVWGILEKRPMPDISRRHGIHYNYVQRVVNKLAKEGLVAKNRVLGKVVVLATPTLRSAFVLALRELYSRAKRGEDISKYGLTLAHLERLFAKEEARNA